MRFAQPKTIIIMVLGGLIATLSIHYVNAVSSNTKKSCEKLLCSTVKETGYNHSQCFMNDSTATFMVDGLEKEYYGLLVIYNQTLCKASRLLNIDQTEVMQEIITKCCTTTLTQNLTLGNPKGSSARFEVKLEPQTDGVFIFIIRNVSLNIHKFFWLEAYKQNQGVCANFENSSVSKLPFTTTRKNLANISRPNPTSNLTGIKNGDQKETETHHLLTYCLVVTFLLLEVLVYVIVHFCSWKKPRGTHEVDNSATNPVYQQGLQIVEFSPSTAQDSYQPLVENTREPGASGEYRGLENGEGHDGQGGVPVDPAGYQDLVQTNQGKRYQSLVIECTEKDKEFRKDYRKYYEHANFSGTDHRYSAGEKPSPRLLDSLRNLARSAISRRFGTSSFSRKKPQPRNLSPLGQSNNKPLHYSLECSETTAEKGPACADTNPKVAKVVPLRMRRVIEELKAVTTDATVDHDDNGDGSFYHVLEGPNHTPEIPESNRDLMGHVLEELKSLNANGPKGESLRDFCAEPLYVVLEDPRDLKDKNAKDEDL